MGRQSLFDAAQNIEESKNDTSNAPRPRSPAFPAEFKTSPYLTSPIRPIPTFKVSKKSKRSTGRSKNEREPTVVRSTIEPPRQKSLDCESSEHHFQSLRYHANGHYASKTKGQPQQLCILLPDEIDDLAKLFGITNMPGSVEKVERDHCCEDGEQEEEYVFESSDDDSTLNSEFAASLDDDGIMKLVDNTKDKIGPVLSCKSSEFEKISINLSNDNDAKEDE